MNAVSPNKTRFPPKSLPIIYKAHTIYRTQPRQPAVKRQHVAKHVITCCVRERSRENYCVRHRFCKCTHRLNINFSDLRHAKPGVVAADVNYDFTVFTFSFSQQLQFGFDVAGSGPNGMQLTMVAGVANLTFLRPSRQ